MVRSLLRRLVGVALVFVIGAGGGGLPILDGLFFHGPDRLAEAFRPHYEASSARCHGDGCSVRSLAQSRVVAEGSARVLLAVPLESLVRSSMLEPVFLRDITLRYLSRAPPSA